MILTSSAINTYLTCQKKYEHRYVNELVPIAREDKALTLGSAVHKGLEILYKEQSIDLAIEEADKIFDGVDTSFFVQNQFTNLETSRKLCNVLLRGYYQNHYDAKNFKVIRPEIQLDMTPLGMANSDTFKGKIDCLVQDKAGKWWVREYKTVSRVTSEYFYHKQIENQILNYIIVVEAQEKIQVEGMLYTYLKKPQLSDGKAYSMEELATKVTSDNFVSNYISISEKQKARQWEFIKAAFSEIEKKLSLTQEVKFLKNTGACTSFGCCPYLKLCVDPYTYKYEYKQENPFKELEESA